MRNKMRDIVILTQEEKERRSSLAKELLEKLPVSEWVYSYTKGRSAKMATEDIQKNIDNFKYFIKLDITSYFRSININKLINILSKANDNKLISEIKKILESDIKKYKLRGLALGSPLSNYLSNYYLLDVDNYYGELQGIKYYRFCDDILILYNNEKDIDGIGKKFKLLDLKINMKKVLKGTTDKPITFLGQEIVKKTPIKTSENNELVNKEIILDKFKNNTNLEKDMDIREEIEKLPKEYSYLHRYHFLKEDKEALIEEMIENNLFKEVYLFEELINKLESKSTIFEAYSKKFFKEESGYLYLNNEEEFVDLDDIITEEILDKHINGEITLAKKLDKENKSNILVFDIDMVNNLSKSEEYAYKIKEELEQRGYVSHIEFSGMKGHHLWLLFNRDIKIDCLNNLANEVLNACNLDKSKVEIIPKDNNITESQRIIKLPLGIHHKSKQRSKFLDVDSLEEIYENQFVDRNTRLKLFEEKIKDEYEDAYDIYKGCSIINDIVRYGILKGDMNHFKRVMLTYVYPFIPSGKEFIHEVIQEMDNYSFSITENHIGKAPENPISCKKIMAYFKGDKSCNCNECLLDSKGGYKNPVLHCKNSKIIEDAINKQAKEIIEEIISLNQERKRLGDKLISLDRKLNNIYEDIGKESIKVPAGNLTKTNGKWIIEIEV